MTIVILLSWVRYYVIVPLFMFIAPLSVMFNGFLGEKIFVHAIVALFVLKLETELFHFVLSDYMRADVERFGRVQISSARRRRSETKPASALLSLASARFQ